jgi:predicted nucleic acid-binding protein
VIVVDASAAVAGLLGHPAARQYLSDEALHAPHLIDNEVASALRRQVSSQSISAAVGGAALRTWASLGVFRYPSVGLLDRVWELRDNLSAYDATYVALAEWVGHPLVTLDARLARAPGVRCEVRVLAAETP